MRVEVVENPRKRRRGLSSKQKAAGFGGKRAMSRRRRRRNPALATLSNPLLRPYIRPGLRRKPRKRMRFYPRPRPIRRRGIRKNPGLLGFKGFNLNMAVMVGVGIVSVEIVPKLVRKFWPAVPTTGAMGYAVKAGAVLTTAYGVKMFTGKNANFEAVIAGGFGSLLVGAFNEYVMPMLPGLNGLSGTYVYPEQLTDVNGMGQYISTESNLGRYFDTNLPEGSY